MGDDAIFEEDIEKAIGLENLRQQTRDMLKRGAESLFSQEYKPCRSGWTDPGDYIEKAYLLKIFKNYQLTIKTSFVFPEKEMEKLEKLSLQKLFKFSDFFKTEEDHVPVLKACVTLDALAMIPDKALCEGSINSLYRIIFELNSVTNSDEIMGGASAGAKYVPKTAFITWRCIRAINSLSETYRNTSIIAKQISTLLEQKPEDIPDEWWAVDLERKKLQAQITINSLKNKGLLSQDLFKNLDDVIKKPDSVISALLKEYSTAVANINKATKEISRIKTFDKGKTAKKRANEICNDLIKKLEENIKYLNNLQSKSPRDTLKDSARNLEEVASFLLTILEPSKKFLSFIIDHELATPESNRNCDAAELLFAADGIGLLGHWDDERIRLALDKTLKLLANNGRFPSYKPFDVADKGYVLHVSGAEVIMAVSNAIQNIDYKVDSAIIKKLLCRFEITWVETAEGWRHERDHSEGLCYWWLSAIVIETLDSLKQMIDKQINQLILKHVSSRNCDELQVSLDDLFYPDYGLVAAGIRKNGIATELQQMRAHILGVETNHEKLHSLILHGPPGTGKTTLAEALAKSSKVPIVEITPSDVLLAGEEKIETRAKIVFKGLAMLTNVVILFDEFDSILWHRNEEQKPESIFQFLTPGMLPKLKNLYENAKQQHVAFVLSTNYIGSLDDAATREGRFDKKLGVYPPDVVSREGRLHNELSKMGIGKPTNKFHDRTNEVIIESRGRGMSRLGKPGWFTKVEKNKNPADETPLAYILNNKSKPRWPAPEAKLPNEPSGKEDKKEEKSNKEPQEDVTQPIPESCCCREWNEWKWVDTLDVCAASDITSITEKINLWKKNWSNFDPGTTHYEEWQKKCNKMEENVSE